MELQGIFVERWEGECLVKITRTANWLLHEPELPPQTYERLNSPFVNSDANDGGVEINWNHPRMQEALRIYFQDKVRFDDNVNLNQEEAPGNIDINPDFWPDASQILRQLRYRDFCTNFGMAKYCPQFSSMDLDRVTSLDGRASELGRAHIVRTPAFLYHELAIQYGMEREQFKATGFDRVVFHKSHEPQAVYYHEYARNLFPMSPAEKYRDVPKQYSMDDDYRQPRRSEIDKTKPDHLKSLGYEASDTKASRLSIMMQNPLLHGIIPMPMSKVKVNKVVSFAGAKVMNYTQSIEERAWKRIPYKMMVVEVRGKMITDISQTEVKIRYRGNLGVTRNATCKTITVGPFDTATELLSMELPLLSGKNYVNSHVVGDGVPQTTPIEHSLGAPCLRQKDKFKTDKGIKTSNESRCPLKKAIRQILSQDDLTKDCNGYISQNEIKDLKPMKEVTEMDKEIENETKVRERLLDHEIKQQKGLAEHIIETDSEITKGRAEVQIIQQQFEPPADYLDDVERKGKKVNHVQRENSLPTGPGVDLVSEEGNLCRRHISSTGIGNTGEFNSSSPTPQEGHPVSATRDMISTQTTGGQIAKSTSQQNRLDPDSPAINKTVPGDKDEWDTTVENEDSMHSKPSRRHHAIETAPGLKRKQDRNILRLIRKRAEHIQSKLNCLNCRSNVKCN